MFEFLRYRHCLKTRTGRDHKVGPPLTFSFSVMPALIDKLLALQSLNGPPYGRGRQHYGYEP